MAAHPCEGHTYRANLNFITKVLDFDTLAGSPNSRYVMRRTSSALTLRLVWQSSLATLPF